ncbi:MAG: hypothetical protein ABI867_19775 [Kofleriaceae bacterium]
MKAPLLVLAMAACTHDIDVFDRVEVQNARDLDILFVFDDSPDRNTYDQMASQLDVLQGRLQDVDGQLPNLHVGVTTTDLGTKGTMDLIPEPQQGNCVGTGNGGALVKFAANVDGDFLEDLRGEAGARVRNYASGDLLSELGKLTNPGTGAARTGCEFEQPLEAMRRALDPGINPGFIRRNAQLAIVFMTNEDDCSFSTGKLLDPNDGTLGALDSFRCTKQGVICDGDDISATGEKTNCRPRDGSPFMVDVSEYQTFLQGYKDDPSDVIVSAVVGAPAPFAVQDFGSPVLGASCQGVGGSAKPAVRIGALVDSMGGVMVDGCAQTDGYQKITAPIVSSQRSCLPNLRRADGEDCRVIEKQVDGTSTELARCADGAPSPCWLTIEDATACPSGDNLGVAIARGDTTVPVGSKIEATCFVK